MRMWLLILTLTGMGCASVARTPAAAGTDGDLGAEGQRGAGGRRGSLILASNCEELALQSISVLHDTSGAENWAPTGAVTYVCGARPDLSAGALSLLHERADAKHVRLLESGYVVGSRADFGGGADWSGLLAKIASLKELYRVIEENPRRDFGCLDGRIKADRVRVCFVSDLRDVADDGLVRTDVTMTATVYQADGTLAPYRTYEERSSVSALPPVCPNHAPQFEVNDQGSSQKQRFTHAVCSTCAGFRSTYSAIYPSLEIVY